MFEFNSELGSMRLYGDVGDYFEDGINEKEVLQALDTMGGEDITVALNSSGGDVFQGLSIYNNLLHYPGNVSITVDAQAFSIASVIAMAGDEVSIFEGSMMMIHNPWTVAVGDAREFRGVADLLDKIGAEIANVYDNKSGAGANYFLSMMENDTYFTAEEALEVGLVDNVITAQRNQKVAAQGPSQLSATACAASYPRRIAAEHRMRKANLYS